MRNNRTKQLILCAMFVALIAIGAFITIPIPIIPLTLQDLFVMLAGIVYNIMIDIDKGFI